MIFFWINRVLFFKTTIVSDPGPGTCLHCELVTAVFDRFSPHWKLLEILFAIILDVQKLFSLKGLLFHLTFLRFPDFFYDREKSRWNDDSLLRNLVLVSVAHWDYSAFQANGFLLNFFWRPSNRTLRLSRDFDHLSI